MIKKIIAIFLSLILCFLSVAYSEDYAEIDDSIDSNDAFVGINVTTINITPIQVVDIKPEDIIINSIKIKSIDNMEIELVSINDEFVTLAYENFVAYYGDDFDFGKFIKDIAIGSGVFLVWVTLSTVGGPIGTFFGAVIASELAPAALIIGAAIDAAIEGWKAYQDGGDLSYILGHMLNGIADGFKWSAFLAPITGAAEGINALKAVKHLKRIPGLEELTQKEAQKIFKKLPELLENIFEFSSKLTEEAAIKTLNKLPKSITAEFSEEILISLIKNQSVVSRLAQKFNPFNIWKEVAKTLRNQFVKHSNIEEKVFSDLIKRIKRRTLKSINEIDDDVIRTFLNENLEQFIEYYSSSLPKSFFENCLKDTISSDVLATLKKTIKHRNSYLELIEKYTKEYIDEILDNPSKIMLLQSCFGIKTIQQLRSFKTLFNAFKRNNVTDESVIEVISRIIDNSIKSLDEIAKIDSKIARNIYASRDLVYTALKNMGIEKRTSDFMGDLTVCCLEKIGIKKDIASEIVSKHLSKTNLDSVIFNQLLDNYNLSIQALGKVRGNKRLIEELTTEVLKRHDLSDEIIESIIKGESLKILGLNPDAVLNIGSILSDYYQYSDSSVYANFIKEYAEIRGQAISRFLEKYESELPITNKNYFAGCIMTPSGSQSSYILEKYGDIYMTSAGFPVFFQRNRCHFLTKHFLLYLN